MPKLKTNKSARKRFRFTKTGKIKRKKANLRHMLSSKTTGTKRSLREAGYVHESDLKAIKKMMPYE